MSVNPNNNRTTPNGQKVRLGSSSLKVMLTKWKSYYCRRRDGIIATTILTPMLIYFLIFIILPIVFVILLSFTEWNGMQGWPKFIGFRNYRMFFKDADYIVTLARAGIYGFIILFINIVIGFFMALLLNQKIKAVGLIRTIWYLPVLVPFAVVAQMLSTLLNPVGGVITRLMNNISGEHIIFQQSSMWMSFWIIAICIWKGVGGTVVIYLAGLQSVDVTLYEAAKVDGARKIDIMWNVTLPSIRPITMFVLITGVVGSFMIFEPVQLISQGGPHGETNTILVRIFEDAFKNFSMGMASTSSVIVLIITMILSIKQFKISQKSIT